MGVPHKHAEVLKAIADGKDVQHKRRCFNVWKDANSNYLECIADPLNNPDDEWRIKPEPKPDVVKNFKASIDIKYGDAIAHSVSDEWIDCSNLKLTFDGETGKLKSAEVIS